MNVLVACEFSGIVRDAFRRAGREAWSCDLEGVQPEGDYPNYHLAGDVRWFLNPTDGATPVAHWDLMIAHPPCTYLANSGVRWLYDERHGKGRWSRMLAGAAFFRTLLEAPIPRIAVENPVIHSHARAYIGRSPDQTLQPWQFGQGETKRVCLWLKNLPKLTPTDIVAGREARVHRMAPGPGRQKERSRFFTGIAAAMAAQWGSLDELDLRAELEQGYGSAGSRARIAALARRLEQGA